MTGPPLAPWNLEGECLVGLAGRGAESVVGTTDEWSDQLHLVSRPALVVAARYEVSPVGGYRELAIAQPARLGLRVGLCFTTMVVDSLDSRLAGRRNWGFPKESGTLDWVSAGEEVELRWEQRSVTIRGEPVSRLALPMLLPMWALQQRSDGPALVPVGIRGWARPVRLGVTVADSGDPLSPLAGEHWGLHVRGLQLVVRPARRPVGVGISLAAPLRPPEPALSSNQTKGD